MDFDRLFELPERSRNLHKYGETAPRRHLVYKHCSGVGVDVGSGGAPVVPWAVQIDRDPVVRNVVHFHDGKDLPFKDNTLDFVFSSHLLEDFLDWDPVLKEWVRVLKPGGKLIIMVPDHVRFRAAVAAGQGDNLDHKHESRPGEITEHVDRIWPGQFKIFMDGYSGGDNAKDYNILFIAQYAGPGKVW